MPQGSLSLFAAVRLFSLSALAACGSAPVSKPQAPPVTRAPVVQEPVRAEPPVAQPPLAPPAPVAQESAGFAEALAKLRPEGTQTLLQALERSPQDASVHAHAAVAFADSDVPGMTLIWGMSYQAMGGGSEDAAVSQALSRVLVERITAKRDPETKEIAFSVRLAPGSMPTREEPDGSVHAPLAHVFESLFAPAVTGFRPPWTIEQFYDVLSSWAGVVAARGTPLDESLELDAWLVATAKAGHLEAFCQRLLGPAHVAEQRAYKASHGAQLKAYQAYLKTAAFAPKRAPVPDELVRIK